MREVGTPKWPAIMFCSIAITVIVFLAAIARPQPSDAPAPSQDLVENIKSEEGFRAHVYSDSRGIDTIGYGTNLGEGITEAEGEMLLMSRLARARECLAEGWQPWVDTPDRIKDALSDMAYQLGCEGVLQFHTMLGYLAAGDYQAAHDDGLSTAWADQTPNRARRVLDEFLP